MGLPSVLFVSSCDYSPVVVIEKVFERALPEKIEIEDHISAYTWNIDNKYYSANVNLCGLSTKLIPQQKFADTIEAVVLFFDCNIAHGLIHAESWLPFIDVYDADIKILVCQQCYNEEGNGYIGVSKHSALEWCIQHGFELVELDPNPEDIDPDDDFPETVGVERIRQALNAHRWPNLILKSEDGNGLGGQSPPPAGDGLSAGIEETFGELLENFDDFGALFSQLSEMKSRLAHLTGDERKRAAEEVVMAFCAALDDGDEL